MVAGVFCCFLSLTSQCFQDKDDSADMDFSAPPPEAMEEEPEEELTPPEQGESCAHHTQFCHYCVSNPNRCISCFSDPPQHRSAVAALLSSSPAFTPPAKPRASFSHPSRSPPSRSPLSSSPPSLSPPSRGVKREPAYTATPSPPARSMPPPAHPRAPRTITKPRHAPPKYDMDRELDEVQQEEPAKEEDMQGDIAQVDQSDEFESIANQITEEDEAPEPLPMADAVKSDQTSALEWFKQQQLIDDSESDLVKKEKEAVKEEGEEEDEQKPKGDASSLRFFWIDAYEDAYRNPGKVYLIGKAPSKADPTKV